jgi:hypothetical protein
MAKTAISGDKNPVGMIAHSMLTVAQFQSLNGTSWVLADGSNVAGSIYATLTGSSTVPDLRGMVLRGKNNGRSDGSQNPDGDSALGAAQGHATAKNGIALSDPTHTHTQGSHQHQIFSLTGNYDAAGGWAADGGSYGHVGSTASVYGIYNSGFAAPAITGAGTGITLGAGDNETRMRNVTVNHFIKIN